MLLAEGEVTFNADGVFYNPKMMLNRDICVAVAAVLKISDYVDALSSSGVRGLRVAKEASVENVHLNDVSPVAYERIIENIGRNGLGCHASCFNANVLLHGRHFEAVDLDPFGSPAPFLGSASRSALSYLFITATDTAPLCGAHLSSGIRKYLARPVKTDYHREMGARILLGAAVRELARIDKAGAPILTHATEHYVRIYLKILHGARAADRSLEKIGYIEHCRICGSWTEQLGADRRPEGRCRLCGAGTVAAGPLWLGPLHDREIIRGCLPLFKEEDRAARLLRTCLDEIDIPMYYDHHNICKNLGITPGRIDDVVSMLQEHGFKASRTHFTGIGIKTDASLDELMRLL